MTGTSEQGFAAEASAGQLKLDPSVAQDLAKAADEWLEVLDQLKAELPVIRKVDGLGDFIMGQLLKGKFEQLASGGPQSLETVLDQHIEATTNLKTGYASSIEALTDQDQQNTTNISAADSGGYGTYGG